MKTTDVLSTAKATKVQKANNPTLKRKEGVLVDSKDKLKLSPEALERQKIAAYVAKIKETDIPESQRDIAAPEKGTLKEVAKRILDEWMPSS